MAHLVSILSALGIVSGSNLMVLQGSDDFYAHFCGYPRRYDNETR